MLDLAVRDRLTSLADSGRRRGAPPLPVAGALQPLLPEGLRRGSTVHVAGSVSLLFALLGVASAEGAWCALVGLPGISAEAADEYGVELGRLAVVPYPGPGWATAVGALLDAVDVVVTRPPPRVVPGDVRRLSARARSHDSVLVPFGAEWPGAEVRLHLREGQWEGVGADGRGRLSRRRVIVTAEGRGRAAQPRTARLWLPAAGGGVDPIDPIRMTRPAHSTRSDSNVIALRAG
ncbi:MAG TPA: hypothetical protein VGL21_14540 [Jatrophihabitantaceae bacterium]|jgi:hypothetical protein